MEEGRWVELLQRLASKEKQCYYSLDSAEAMTSPTPEERIARQKARREAKDNLLSRAPPPPPSLINHSEEGNPGFQETSKLQRIGLTVAGAIVVIGGVHYLASPFLAIQGLRSGFLSKNADQVNKYIDYPALQADLKAQIGAMMLKSMQSDPEMAVNPFSGFALAMITPMVNSMVDTYVTPSGMKTILESSATEQRGANQDQTAQNLVDRKREFDKALEKTSMGYEGFDKFQLTATADDGKKTKLLFNRQGFADWKLKAVVLPQP